MADKMKWTKLHDLKVLLLYRQWQADSSKNLNQRCKVLKNNDDSFDCPAGSIRMKVQNIQSYLEGKGNLDHVGSTHEKIFNDHKDYSIKELKQIIEQKLAD